MFRLNAALAVYLHREPIDFRKNINGLAALVEHELALDPFADALYVFGNRRRDRIKILGWSRNGFWLLQKRLESERFIWPRDNQRVVELTQRTATALAARRHRSGGHARARNIALQTRGVRELRGWVRGQKYQ